MMGEFDLAKSPRPGDRLLSMMSPSITLKDGKPHLVVGSAGSLRLRGAVMQVVANVVAHGLPVDDAIDRPRIHLEGDELHCEGGHDPSSSTSSRSSAGTSSAGRTATSSSEAPRP